MIFLPAGLTSGIRPEHPTIADVGRIGTTMTHDENPGGDTNVLASGGPWQDMSVRLHGQHAILTNSAVIFDCSDTAACLPDAQGARAVNDQAA